MAHIGNGTTIEVRPLSSFRTCRPCSVARKVAVDRIAVERSSKMNIFTIIGVIVVVLFVVSYFGLHMH